MGCAVGFTKIRRAAFANTRQPPANFLFLCFSGSSYFPAYVVPIPFLPVFGRVSQAILLLIGCVVGSFQARELFKLLHTSTMPVTEQIHWFEGWFSRSTLIIYGLLAGRVGLFRSIYSAFARSDTDRLSPPPP
jgi:hypothetical protein